MIGLEPDRLTQFSNALCNVSSSVEFHPQGKMSIRMVGIEPDRFSQFGKNRIGFGSCEGTGHGLTFGSNNLYRVGRLGFSAQDNSAWKT